MLGWFTKWRGAVDFGLRPRQPGQGIEVNLYPFTKRAAEYLGKNVEDFKTAAALALHQELAPR